MSHHQKKKFREHYEHVFPELGHPYLHRESKKEHKKHREEAEEKKPQDTVMEFMLAPVATEEESLAQYVAICGRTLTRRNVRHQVYSTGTVMEGSFEECAEALKECVIEALKKAPRILLSFTADIRPGYEGRMHTKIQAIHKAMEARKPRDVPSSKEFPEEGEGEGREEDEEEEEEEKDEDSALDEASSKNQ